LNYVDGALTPQTITNFTVNTNAGTITGLAAGVYNDISITVAGCTSLENIDAPLTVAGTPTITLGTPTDPIACGTADGTIPLTFTNVPDGTTYTLNYVDGSSTLQAITNFTVSGNAGTITGLLAGVYNDITITELGCTSLENIDVLLSNPVGCVIGGLCSEVAISTTTTSATCTNFDGTVTIDIDPIRPAVNPTGVKIDIEGPVNDTEFPDLDGTGSIVFTGLVAGEYTFTIEYGEAACTKTGNFTIDQTGSIGQPVASDIQNAVCFGESSGSLRLDIEGGLFDGQSLEYSYDGTNFTSFLEGDIISDVPVGQGTSSETVINVRSNASDLCFSSVTVIMGNQFEELTATITTVQDATCNNNDGVVQVGAVTGGDGTYSYQIDGTAFGLPANTEISGLSRGGHVLNITDGLGCSVDVSFQVNSPGLVVFTAMEQSAATCTGDGNDGVIFVDVTEADGSVFYSIDGAAFEEAPGLSFTIPNQAIGIHDLILTSGTSSGCPNATTVTTTGFSPIKYTDLQITDIECNSDGVNGSKELGRITVNGIEGNTEAGVTLTATLFDPSGFQVVQNVSGDTYVSGELSEPGEYRLVLKQNGGCNDEITFFNGGSDNLPPLEQPSLIEVGLITTTTTLEGLGTGTLSIEEITGGAPTYEVTLDGIDFDNRDNFEIQSGIEPFNGVSFEGLFIGEFLISITDANGCQLIVDPNPVVEPDTEIFIPNVFTPNGDEFNELFYIRNLPIDGSGTTLTISNRWGKEVFTSSNYYYTSTSDNSLWNGGEEAEGVYFYSMSLSDGVTYTGWVEVMRGSK
jgi:gliding motility-associated-like protein